MYSLEKAMNILLDSHPHYNYMDATLAQGFNDLGHTAYGRNRNGHNYCTPHNGEPFDLFVQCQAFGDPLSGVPSIMLWGEDGNQSPGSQFYPFLGKDFTACFVRDYRGGGPDNVFPMNFGVEARYFCASMPAKNRIPLRQRKVDLAFYGNIDTHNRQMYAQALAAYSGEWNIKIGGQEFRQGDNYWTRWTGTYRPHDVKYYQLLADSKIAISFMGHGPDCARHWEVLASGAVPFIERMPTIMCPPPLRDGEHCFFFSDVPELVHKMELVLKDPIQFQHIADKAVNVARYNHSTAARARYVLSKFNEVVSKTP